MKDFKVDDVASVGIELEPNELAFLLGMLEYNLITHQPLLVDDFEELSTIAKTTYQKLKGFVEEIELASK